MFFDSHSHLHDAKFDADRDAVLERAREAGVTRILTLGDTLAASRAAIALAEERPEVIAAAGIHPCSARSWDDTCAAELESLLAHPRAAVLGEIGLDYYWEKDDDAIARQQYAFREQLRLARSLGYAVSIHTRESTADVLRILREEHGGEIGGVLHCFSGTIEEAEAAMRMGFYLGVGGTSTYPKSTALRDILMRGGLSRLLIETDAPYLPPQPMRGKRNEPAFVAMTARALAELFSVTVDEVARITSRNTTEAFRLRERGMVDADV